MTMTATNKQQNNSMMEVKKNSTYKQQLQNDYKEEFSQVSKYIKPKYQK